MTNEEALKVKIGDSVGFKCDVEQGSKVYDIRQRRLFMSEYVIEFEVNVERGGYSHGRRWINAEDCW